MRDDCPNCGKGIMKTKCPDCGLVYNSRPGVKHDCEKEGEEKERQERIQQEFREELYQQEDVQVEQRDVSEGVSPESPGIEHDQLSSIPGHIGGSSETEDGEGPVSEGGD